MAMTTDEIVLLNKIKLDAEVLAMIIARAELKSLRKDTAIWMIRDKINELNSKYGELQVKSLLDEAIVK